MLSSLGNSISSAYSGVQNAIQNAAQQNALNQAKSQASSVATGGTNSSGQNRLQQLASALSQDNACWSCLIYQSVYKGMRQLVDQSYAYFVGGSSGMLGLASLILSIAVLVRVLPIVTGTDDGRAAAGLRIFFMRVLCIFTLFLGSSVVSSSGSFISDWFIDGPLAAGTAIGTKLASVTSQAYSSVAGGTSPMGDDTSSSGGGGTPTLKDLDSGTSVTGLSDLGLSQGGNPTGLQDTGDRFAGQPGGQQGTPLANNSPNALTMSYGNSSGSTDMGQAHVTAAVAMLKYLHNLGVAGIVTGVWVATEGPVQQASNVVAFIAMIIAGVMIAFMFFMAMRANSGFSRSLYS